MLFNSLEFLIFFPVVTALFFALPHAVRWVLLLAASCFFYMFFKPEYILILFFTIVVDYAAGIWLEQTVDPHRKKRYLVLSLLANVGILAIFKYYPFIQDNSYWLSFYTEQDWVLPCMDIVLPIGLSFHTFQAMSYTIEVYRGNQKAERHFGIYALYVMFYPQLVAGPIERPQNILHQFRERQRFSYDNAVEGLHLIAIGLFKKVVVADRLSSYVNNVYGDLEQSSSLMAALAAAFFSFQIYCDFSGYSDMARGTARFMGFELMVNFDRPYTAQSISEFWRRWHISLSTWFRDYLYIPLGGNRRSALRNQFNVLVVFLVSGLWHGANWTFVLWGGLHGLLIVLDHATRAVRTRVADAVWGTRARGLRRLLNIGLVFSLVSLLWVFFRSDNFVHAWEFFGRLFAMDFQQDLFTLSAWKGNVNFALCLLAIGMLMLIAYIPARWIQRYTWQYLFVLTVLIILLGKNGNEFIYFQF
jgi:D-alanyl-lipoteichoic acid acyltransferase DltB (MBOAT superfamily)